MPELSQALAEHFGFRSFRPHQEGVVRAIMAGRDTFTLMPTGGGKSLCYQLPARLMPGACVVVSPLISLMKDQVDAARINGFTAAAFNSASSPMEKREIRESLATGKLDLLYIAPERLQYQDFLDLLRHSPPAFFAVDEAHCLSQWGHDFRPDYLRLSLLREEFPNIPIAAFTATATARVEADVAERLGLRDPLRTKASFNRPNLFYQVIPKADFDKQLLEFICRHPDEPGIVYRTTRKHVESTAALLKKHGVNALPYHAGLGDAERAAAQEAFRRDVCPVITATVAFGMGIDKPNVRWVIHGDLPKDLESYYQETGRAGRDGDPARCVLFYGRADIPRLIHFADQVPEEEARAAAKTRLYRMLDFTQKDGCRRKALLGYFGEEAAEENCGACDVCTGEALRDDATRPAQMLLSAMIRTKERFGAGHIADIVRGRATEKITSRGHDQLPTFGVGKEYERRYLLAVLDALAVQGLTECPDSEFPTPAVTARGWEVLKGSRVVSMLRPPERQRKRKDRESAKPQEAAVAQGIFDLLRAVRLKLAQKHGVPPYMVFNDRTLREMAQTLPTGREELLALNGVGDFKAQAYGRPFLEAIAEYRGERA